MACQPSQPPLPVIHLKEKRPANRWRGAGREGMSMSNKSKFCLSAKLQDSNFGTRILHLKGRDAWTLNELVRCGEQGCTPIHNPAPRWSAYVHNLRSMGFRIETITEPHDGTFSGTHARYVLRTPVTIENVTMPMEGKLDGETPTH